MGLRRFSVPYPEKVAAGARRVALGRFQLTDNAYFFFFFVFYFY